MDGAIAPQRRREVRHRHRPPRPGRQGRRAARSTSCSACRPTSRRPTSRSASTSPRSSPSGPRGPPQFPALKIKVGGPADLETLEAVRAVYDGPIRVDANTGWEPETALALLPELVRLGVELIEQPFPARRLDQLRWLQERSPLPIVADESCGHDRGPRRARRRRRRASTSSWPSAAASGRRRRMLERARELGFRTFLGCMEETSVGIAASAAVASLADWVDLDGNLLLADDPFEGLELGPDCRWRLSDAPGLGSVAAPGLSRSGSSTAVRRRTSVRVDKLVDEMVDKPPSTRARPAYALTGTRRPSASREGRSRSSSDPSRGRRSARTRPTSPV